MLVILLMLVFSFLLHAVAEIWYLGWAKDNNYDVSWTLLPGVGLCALPWYILYGLPIIAIIGGFWLGNFWWKIVYGKR